MRLVGIDVGSKELVVVILVNGKATKAKTFANTAEGHAHLVKVLNKYQEPARVCLEATGSYHFDLAVALSKEPNIEVMVVNPKASKNFAAVLMNRSKTDVLDAEVLAVYCERMDFKAWKCPAPNRLALRTCSRRLVELKTQRARAKNQLHALETVSETPEYILRDARQAIEELETRVETLQGHALEIVKQDEVLEPMLKFLLSVKGIAEVSAVQILGEVAILPPDMTARQWVAHAGLDPRHFSSGTSVMKKPRLSKAGNRYLRLALYMPALVASQWEPAIKGYYQHLIVDNGLKKIQAICAVMRKLLHAIHAMFTTQTDFDGSKFYRGANATLS